MNRFLRFLYNSRDHSPYCTKTILGIKIVTKPLRLQVELLNHHINEQAKNIININSNYFISSEVERAKQLLIEKNIPFLTSVIAVYNLGERYLRPCLDSIVNQTLKNIEIIIVNDCSPNEEDDRICLEYANKDSRVKYIKHEENKGLGGVRTTGFKEATGYSISFYGWG